ncbi:solute carrier family 35 member E3-like [Liolophura sinensis]|uniref:solute carrier family 35 member E3-like n=1 Tax=Liolophura sinensis TaxID=3198878 RepID=UPI0031583FE0
MADKGTNAVTVLFCLILNLCSAVLIILLNKTLYTLYGCPNITLTFIHFLMTSAGLIICERLNVFQVKILPFRSMLPLALTFCGFVVLTNLSLQSNTVGTYQLIKTMTTPCIIAIQTFAYSRRFSFHVKCTVIPITLGVLMNSYYDIKFNVIGIIFAVSGVMVTSLYQVWVAEKQHEFQVNPMQLLFYQAPLSALLLVPVVPILESPWAHMFSWSFETLALIFLSGLVAFMVNLSSYWILKATSPMTYNMVGHLKFCLTLLGGYVIFQESIQILQVFGIIMTLSGILAYTYFKMEEQKKSHLPHSVVSFSKGNNS